MIRTRVLVVEDDVSTQEFYENFFCTLHKDEFIWHMVQSGEKSLAFLANNPIDIVVLDWNLPGMSGMEALKHIRANKATRFVLVFIVTAHTRPEEISSALEAGADDYLPKPFSDQVLLARLHSLKRRRALVFEEHKVYEIEDLRLDPAEGILHVDERQVELSGKERDLLIIFMRRSNMVHSASYLLETIWGYEPTDHHALERHISSLRKKLSKKWGVRLQSKYGEGYYLATQASAVL